MAELREFLPYLIVLFLMWNAKQETYFDKYWHLGMLDVICADSMLSGVALVSGKKTASGKGASISAAYLQHSDSFIHRKSDQSGKKCDDSIRNV